jgi:N-acetylglucosaminyldiphosphoundecaprenol N-acetyl-beta-D-mannosaminyltransferase
MRAGVNGPSPGCPFPSREFLGVRLDLLTLQQLLGAVTDAVARRAQLRVMYLNAHCMNISAADPSYRTIVNRADIVYCDGTGVKLGARALGIHVPQRMTGADWIHDLAAIAAREEMSLFLLGGEPGSAQGAAVRLLAEQPKLRIAGTASGFNLSGDTIAQIRAAGPDILLVGMGTPTQERWIDGNQAQLDVPVIWAVGALFDFVSGRIPRGPAWMTNHGLEWLCRLAVEPGKLWRRYVFGNPRFLFRVARSWWRHTRA